MNKYFSAIFFLIITFCSCNSQNDSYDEGNNINSADVFLESDQYKEYEKIVKQDSMIVKNALKALTSEERKEYFTLMSSVTQNTTEAEYDSIFHRIYELTNIDTDKRLKTLHQARTKMMEGVTFSKRELLQAMQRHCLNMNRTIMTRSYDEVDRAQCRNECSAVYSSVYWDCDPTGGTGGLDHWAETRYCDMIATDAYDECMRNCE